MNTLNNKWPGPKTAWSVDLTAYEPALSLFTAGVLPVSVVLDPRVGTEVVLFIVDRTDFAYEIARLEKIKFHVKSGLTRCPSGPVMFLLYGIATPQTPEIPFVSFENTVNPHDATMMQSYWDLARQTHWHVFVIGPDDEELIWYEIENKFRLRVHLDQVAAIVPGLPCTNFDMAKLEFQQRYSVDDLIKM